MKFTREPEDEEDQLPLYEEMMEHEGHGCAYEVSGRRGYDPDTNSDSEEEMKSGATTNNINVVVTTTSRDPILPRHSLWFLVLLMLLMILLFGADFYPSFNQKI